MFPGEKNNFPTSKLNNIEDGPKLKRKEKHEAELSQLEKDIVSWATTKWKKKHTCPQFLKGFFKVFFEEFYHGTSPFFTTMFYGLYHEKSPFFTTIWGSMFGFFFQPLFPCSKSKVWNDFCFLPGGDGEERGFEKVYLLWVLSQRIRGTSIFTHLA